MTTMTAYDFCKIEGHVKPVNPRHKAAFDGAGCCSRCGRKLEVDETTRNVELEEKWTLDAARYAQYVVDHHAAAATMNMYRSARTGGSSPWRDVSERNWIDEAIEECVDLNAYLCAEMQRLVDNYENHEGWDKQVMLVRMAMAASITAFHSLMQAKKMD